MKKTLLILGVIIWITASCIPIIFIAKHIPEVDVWILMFGHVNAFCIGVFISVIYIEYWR
ncbi:hypothetical protein HII09_005451 [Escherichia coli]|nr:hypothetical protein [Escherichia coli]EFJ1163802.1 hypothetical protein [Escherichia coli]